MRQQKLMTAILTDGSQVTGAEVSQNIHGNEIILASDGHEIPIDMFLCVSYFEEADPIGFDELTPIEAAELERLENLSALLTHQAY